jgi:hypothetical protein
MDRICGGYFKAIFRYTEDLAGRGDKEDEILSFSI